MARNRRPQADAGGEVIVALGPFDQPDKAVLGKFGAGIVDGALDHLVVAAQYQHVGHRAAQHPAGRDCHQMRLALAAGGFDQRLVVEPFRSGQYRTGDLDDIVERQGADGGRRRAADRSEAVGEQRLGRCLDVTHQALEYIVEQFDLLVGKIHRAVDEKIGHPAQGLDAARHGAVRERRLQLVEQVFGSGGGFRTHDSILERSGIVGP